MTSPPAVKVVDLIKNSFSYSFEVTPDVRVQDFDELKLNPGFVSVTWHARKHGCKSLDIGPLRVAKSLREKGNVILLHLSCDLMTKSFLDGLLKFLKANGICNLFVVLGEAFDENESDFKNSKDLVQYIRKETGDYFCIGVAGFPRDNDLKLAKLREKVECGADFIITQALFDANVYREFLRKCDRSSIKVPIIPGVLFFDNFDDLINFTTSDKISLSTDLLVRIKTNPEPESKALLRKIITDIKHFGFSNVNVHIFTMNCLSAVSLLLKEII